MVYLRVAFSFGEESTRSSFEHFAEQAWAAAWAAKATISVLARRRRGMFFFPAEPNSGSSEIYS